MAEQLVPQSMPAGSLTTLPPPDVATVRVPLGTVKVAVTVRAAVSGTVQVVAVPVQPPDQLPNCTPASGAAVSTTSPWSRVALQVLPQEMPAGALVTVPVPEPALTTLSVHCLTNAAPTLLAESIVTTHEPVPVHAPLQPPKRDPAEAAGVSVTDVPERNEALQTGSQLIPDGLLVTVPVPVPPLVTDSANIGVKVAVTDRGAVMLIVQVLPVDDVHPDQLVNAEPADGEAVRVTEVLVSKAALHVVPQSMPAGELDTPPLPAPALFTVSTTCGTNVAVTVRAADMVTVHVPVPEQSPLQPEKRDPLPGAAVMVTTVPVSNSSVQSPGQLTPAGELETVPVPAPAVSTLSPHWRVNVAVTLRAADIVTTQVDVPVQSPLQPAKRDPLSGEAVSVTLAPLS